MTTEGVTAIGVGAVETSRIAGMKQEGDLGAFVRTAPMQRSGDSSAIAGVGVFLCSDAAGDIAAQSISGDGGALYA